MRDVAAPLYRFFLADAQAAARAGDLDRALECLGLALDFAPESQRERVLLAAAELVPPASGSAGSAPREGFAATSLVVEIAGDDTAHRPQGRIAWEERVLYPTSRAEPFVPLAPLAPPPAASRDSARRLRWPILASAVLAVVFAAGLRFGWPPPSAANVLRADPVVRAMQQLDEGDAGGALRALDPLGMEAPARAWLLRASAYEVLGDTAAAVAALTLAAARDADGGGWALEAGDRLGRLGAVPEAADAYLFAVTPLRTDVELDRIARMQERAGYEDRARRVLQR